jgi:hypothetical protein
MIVVLFSAVVLVGIAYIVAREHGSARPLTAALKFFGKALLAVFVLTTAAVVWLVPADSPVGKWRDGLVGTKADDRWGNDPRARRAPTSGNPFDKYQSADGTCWSEPDSDGWQTQVSCK